MPKVSQVHRDARRRQIIEAAGDCFAREGFHRTTMQDIVRQSGLSPGAIYRYFASKDAIIEAMADERHTWEQSAIAAAQAQQGTERFLEMLAQPFFDALRDEGERRRRRLGLQLWAEALRNPRLLQIVREGVDEPRRLLAERIAAAQAQGDLPAHLAPDAVARVIIALFQGFILQQAWDEQIDIDAYVEAIGCIQFVDGDCGS
jgi:TetR/AcrR family transcriptional regulator, transcriptional repressor of aconitase